ncbi:helix-turn-helix transcriptional regulator [Streptomyces sp. DH10]|uniref:helix-turn-helix transcriptional regulator n=1 Tax=Streptomyces sp. DH10 TaxID=3040121 RepID=UPI00244366C9|nr:helix-turn-helix transcriptional regulator [Streptomyces sp. DH10]MDG9711410.1 LuxR C-terminal-related transcriptional regulator [Streptomyces sp. DH10]
MTSVSAVLDDRRVLILDDQAEESGMAATLVSVGLSLLRRVSAWPRETGPALVYIDSFLNEGKHNAKPFIAVVGWIDERRLLATAVAKAEGFKEGANPWRDGRLTRREAEVAGLAARGLTNKEIAQKIFLSMGGVAYHLGNIYAKLGLRNRYQLRDLWMSAMDEPESSS